MTQARGVTIRICFSHVDGNVAEFGLDVTGQSEFLGNGPFRPTIRVVAVSSQIPPPGQPDVLSYQQYCRWDSPVTDQSGPSSEATTAPENPYPAPPAPARAYSPFAASAVKCLRRGADREDRVG